MSKGGGGGGSFSRWLVVFVGLVVDGEALDDGPNDADNDDGEEALQNSEGGALAVAALGVVVGSHNRSHAGHDNVEDQHNKGDVLGHKRVSIRTALVRLGGVSRVGSCRRLLHERIAVAFAFGNFFMAVCSTVELSLSYLNLLLLLLLGVIIGLFLIVQN